MPIDRARTDIRAGKAASEPMPNAMPAGPGQGESPPRWNGVCLDWPDKAHAEALAGIPSPLAPVDCPGESLGAADTGNWFIEGDNLDALKCLLPRFEGTFRLILIDPPYNTDGHFIYSDRHGSSRVTRPDASSLQASHEGWWSMMWPRLILARRLLAPDGVLVVHIDEHESVHLRLMLRELFGAAHDLGEIIWNKCNPKGDSSRIAQQHETLLAFARDRQALHRSRPLQRVKRNAERMLSKAAQLARRVGALQVPEDLRAVVSRYALPVDPLCWQQTYTLDDARRDFRDWLGRQEVSGGEMAYRHLDAQGRVYRTVSMAWPGKRRPPPPYFVPLHHPGTGQPCPVPERGWRNSPETMARLLDEDRIVFGADERKQPERKYLLDDYRMESIPSVWQHGGSDDALLARLGIPFDNPKPLELVESLILAFTGGSGRVLDFFAGSGTVGHACLNLQARGHDLPFTLVQWREALSPDHPGQAAGARFCAGLARPANIAEIAKERLRRAARSLGAVSDPGAAGGAFRVYRLQASTLPWPAEWQPATTVPVSGAAAPDGLAISGTQAADGEPGRVEGGATASWSVEAVRTEMLRTATIRTEKVREETDPADGKRAGREPVAPAAAAHACARNEPEALVGEEG